MSTEVLLYQLYIQQISLVATNNNRFKKIYITEIKRPLTDITVHGRVCDWWFNVDCADSPGAYNINEDLYRVTEDASLGRELLREEEGGDTVVEESQVVEEVAIVTEKLPQQVEEQQQQEEQQEDQQQEEEQQEEQQSLEEQEQEQTEQQQEQDEVTSDSQA